MAKGMIVQKKGWFDQASVSSCANPIRLVVLDTYRRGRGEGFFRSLTASHVTVNCQTSSLGRETRWYLGQDRTLAPSRNCLRCEN